MKSTQSQKQFSIALLFFTMLFTACADKDDPKKEEEGAVTASITVGNTDPYSFVYNPVAIAPVYLGGPDPQGKYNLKASFVEVRPSKTINITGHIDGVGTYHFDAGKDDFSVMVLLRWDDGDTQSQFYTLPPGSDPKYGNFTLTVTSFEADRFKGTFSGTLYSQSGEKAVIREGVFDVNANGL